MVSAKIRTDLFNFRIRGDVFLIEIGKKHGYGNKIIGKWALRMQLPKKEV